jgi:hypothetical protein
MRLIIGSIIIEFKEGRFNKRVIALVKYFDEFGV